MKTTYLIAMLSTALILCVAQDTATPTPKDEAALDTEKGSTPSKVPEATEQPKEAETTQLVDEPQDEVVLDDEVLDEGDEVPLQEEDDYEETEEDAEFDTLQRGRGGRFRGGGGRGGSFRGGRVVRGGRFRGGRVVRGGGFRGGRFVRGRGFRGGRFVRGRGFRGGRFVRGGRFRGGRFVRRGGFVRGPVVVRRRGFISDDACICDDDY